MNSTPLPMLEESHLSPVAGKPADRSVLVDVPKLVTSYYNEVPDVSRPSERVVFGTSGHRGSSLERSFNEHHILAISQAICLYRKQEGIDGPLFMGMDTHALSVPAQATALEVLAANGVEVMLATDEEYTPTPAISHAILTYNRGRKRGLADGIVARSLARLWVASSAWRSTPTRSKPQRSIALVGCAKADFQSRNPSGMPCARPAGLRARQMSSLEVGSKV